MGSSDDRKRVDRAAKLAEKQRELLAQLHDVTEELRKVLAGEPAIGDLMRRLSAHWGTCWSVRYDGRYAWEGVRDSAAAKRLLKAFAIEELEARADAYLADPEPYLVQARHPFALFASRINRYAPMLAWRSAVMDCRHVPPCRTDAEHTSRAQQELRA